MPIIDSDLATAKEIFDVNVFGLVAVTQACSPMLVAAKGKVINMSSVKSRAAIPFSGMFVLFFIQEKLKLTVKGMYNATKAAVTSISDVMRIELEPFGVQVITVCHKFRPQVYINQSAGCSWQSQFRVVRQPDYC